MTVAASMIEFIASQDARLMRRVHRWRPPRWVRLWMVGSSRGGDGWVWLAQGAAILAFGGAARYPAVGAAAAAAAAGIVIFLILKRRIGRRRPSSIEPHCWATLLPPDQFSFPSGHTITAFAVSVPIAHYYPAAVLACLFAAGSVALSRIVLGMHFLSDVVAGGVIGCVLGYGAVLLFG